MLHAEVCDCLFWPAALSFSPITCDKACVSERNDRTNRIQRTPLMLFTKAATSSLTSCKQSSKQQRKLLAQMQYTLTCSSTRRFAKCLMEHSGTLLSHHASHKSLHSSEGLGNYNTCFELTASSFSLSADSVVWKTAGCHKHLIPVSDIQHEGWKPALCIMFQLTASQPLLSLWDVQALYIWS